MTVLQFILAVAAFALCFWLINRYAPDGLFRKILLGVVIVLALLVILQGFGLMNLLDTPIAPAPYRYGR